ncbi:hypothetical protein BROUX41_006136 [Berkeleyomyces rouxiae]|uniref:uncharacterized protein n=1 Tax=Berkeleyomyces rouxiae TaxID=2035830 RepID=UPI003B794E38
MSKPQDLEKVSFEHVNDTKTLERTPSDEFGFSPEKQRKIIRTIDRRLVVIVGVMYCVSLMDRTNMSAAAIAGMRTEIRLVDNKYQVANLVFFITYTLFQPPSTILIRKIGPRVHLSVITLLWGGVLIGMGFVDNFSQLAVCRVLLGLLEAGFFPSCVYLLSTWYTRFEVGKRYSVFYLLGSFASGCSGILAYGLMQMDGTADLTGWRWIFIMEGIMTCVIAFIGYWLLVDFPDSDRQAWNFLGPRERAWIVARVEKDRGDSAISKFNLGVFLRSAKDWKIWLYALSFFCATTQSYALAYTLPIILMSSLKFSIAKAQCLVAPPYAFAGILMFTTGYIGDKYRIRGPIVAVNSIIAVVGLAIMGFVSDPWVRYFGVFLAAAGSNGNIPSIMSYQANNIRGQWKRAFCSATMVGFGGIGGIAGSLVFRDEDAPSYKPGYYACMTCSGLSVLIVCVLSFEFRRQNNKAIRGEKVLEAEEMENGDDFRYTY